MASLLRVGNAGVISGENDGLNVIDVEAKKKRRPLVRHERKRDAKPMRMIAWDLETSNIAEGTPEPRYITAYGLDPEYSLEMPIRSMQHLGRLIINQFLIPEFQGIKFVAWNSNNFDSYLVAMAILLSDEHVIRPYLNRANQLRGMRVIHRDDAGLAPASQRCWEFLDGMAMLGLPTTSLEKFLDNFAPEFRKLKEAINFDVEEFNPRNLKHRQYAMRDSVGLYHGMVRAQQIMIEQFNQPLTVTIGNACIKIFKANLPHHGIDKNSPLAVYAPDDELERIIREYVMRGGFCYCVRQYHGPVWKYDLNQAYAAAMREAKLPAGHAMHSTHGINPYASVYIARVTARNPHNKVPFYYATIVGSKVKAAFATTTIDETWLTSIEVEQLRSEGWEIQVMESYCWDDHFSMKDFVDMLERVRTTCDGGPSGPIGTMIKGVGNNAYGKTVSESPGEAYLLSKDRPEGYAETYWEGDPEPVPNVWNTFEKVDPKDYEQPQLGSFITAYVRMVVRRAALQNPDAWLYADTDCAVFSCDVTAQLDTDSKRYGAWKIEEEGTVYKIIAKKVYYNTEKKKGNAKGMNIRRLTEQHFNDWFEGKPPEQTQVQRNNFMKVMAGMDMYRTQTRRGTSVTPKESAISHQKSLAFVTDDR